MRGRGGVVGLIVVGGRGIVVGIDGVGLGGMGEGNW